MPQVAIEAHGICEVTSTLNTGACIDGLMSIGRVSLDSQVERCVINAEIHHFAGIGLSKMGYGRIIRVENQDGTFWQHAYRLLPARRYCIHFTVAIELIAEQVIKDGHT